MPPKKSDKHLEADIFISRKKKFNTNHSAEFKTTVIMDMSENPLRNCGTVDKFIGRLRVTFTFGTMREYL